MEIFMLQTAAEYIQHVFNSHILTINGKIEEMLSFILLYFGHLYVRLNR